MIRNYFWVMRITIEKIIIEKNPGGPVRPRDIPWRAPKCLNVKPTRNSQGTNTKIDDFIKKIAFQK